MSTPIPLSSLRRDPADSVRAARRPQVVAEYAAAMRAGAVFPPVVVFRDLFGVLWLADGGCRVEAAIVAMLAPTIEADMRVGSREDAVAYARQSNADHGERRSDADKRLVGEALIREEMERRQGPAYRPLTDRKLAEQGKLSHTFIGQLFRDLGLRGAPLKPATTGPRAERAAEPAPGQRLIVGGEVLPTSTTNAKTEPTLAQLRDRVDLALQRAVRLGVEEFDLPDERGQIVGLWVGDIDDEPRDRLLAALAGLEAACAAARVDLTPAATPEPTAADLADTERLARHLDMSGYEEEAAERLADGLAALAAEDCDDAPPMDPTSTRTLADLDAREAVIGAFRELVAERDSCREEARRQRARADAAEAGWAAAMKSVQAGDRAQLVEALGAHPGTSWGEAIEEVSSRRALGQGLAPDLDALLRETLGDTTPEATVPQMVRRLAHLHRIVCGARGVHWPEGWEEIQPDLWRGPDRAQIEAEPLNRDGTGPVRVLVESAYLDTEAEAVALGRRCAWALEPALQAPELARRRTELAAAHQQADDARDCIAALREQLAAALRTGNLPVARPGDGSESDPSSPTPAQARPRRAPKAPAPNPWQRFQPWTGTALELQAEIAALPPAHIYALHHHLLGVWAPDGMSDAEIREVLAATIRGPA